MKRRRLLRVELRRHASLVAGPGAHELIRECTGRLPVWVSKRRAFSVQEDTARDVVALAETLGYDVEITGPRTRREADGLSPMTAAAHRFPEQPDPGRGLW